MENFKLSLYRSGTVEMTSIKTENSLICFQICAEGYGAADAIRSILMDAGIEENFLREGLENNVVDARAYLTSGQAKKIAMLAFD